MAQLDMERIIEALFPDDPVVIEQDGQKYAKYDSIELTLLEDETVATFCYKDKGYVTIRMQKAVRGRDDIKLTDLQGLVQLPKLM